MTTPTDRVTGTSPVSQNSAQIPSIPQRGFVFFRDTLSSYASSSHCASRFKTLMTSLGSYLYRCWEWLKQLWTGEDPALLSKWNSAVQKPLTTSPNQETLVAEYLVSAAARNGISCPFARILITQTTNSKWFFPDQYPYDPTFNSNDTLIIMLSPDEKPLSGLRLKVTFDTTLDLYGKRGQPINEAYLCILSQDEIALLQNNKMPNQLKWLFEIAQKTHSQVS